MTQPRKPPQPRLRRPPRRSAPLVAVQRALRDVPSLGPGNLPPCPPLRHASFRRFGGAALRPRLRLIRRLIFGFALGWSTHTRRTRGKTRAPRILATIGAALHQRGPTFIRHVIGRTRPFKRECYDFPRCAIDALGFEAVFSKCVDAMRPTLVVTLGRLASRHIRTDHALRERVDERKGHSGGTERRGDEPPKFAIVQLFGGTSRENLRSPRA